MKDFRDPIFITLPLLPIRATSDPAWICWLWLYHPYWLWQPLPHEDLKDFGDKIDEATNTDKTEMVGETDCTVYKITLTEEAATAMIPMSRMLERMEDVEIEGTGKVWLDEDGNIHKYTTNVTVVASFNGNDFEIGMERTVSVYAIGKTEVEIPKGAKKAIEGNDEDY